MASVKQKSAGPAKKRGQEKNRSKTSIKLSGLSVRAISDVILVLIKQMLEDIEVLTQWKKDLESKSTQTATTSSQTSLIKPFRSWSLEEEHELMNMYHHQASIREMALKFNRSIKAIRSKIYDIGMGPGRKAKPTFAESIELRDEQFFEGPNK